MIATPHPQQARDETNPSPHHNPSGMPVILLLEGIVMAIEAAWYYLFVKDLRQAAIYSVLCNAISFLIGILIESILVLLETI